MPHDIVEADVLAAAGARHRVGDAAEANDAERVILIASGSVASSLVKDLEAGLGDRHAATHVGIGQHGPADAVDAATQAARDAGADGLVTLGGGSVLDAGKFVAWTLGDGGRAALPVHVAVPTTLSGAEFTLLAGRTVPGPDGRPVKTGMADARIIPDVVLSDPEACVPTPRWLWAATGIRAVDHGVEGILSPQAPEAVVERCLVGLRSLRTALPASVADADDLDATLSCLEASREVSAGINYANAGAGLSHKLGKAIGASWDIPHGVTSAITLPAVLDLAERRGAPRLQALGDALGASSAADGVRHLVAELGIEARSLASYGITEADVPTIVAYAIGGPDEDVADLVRALL